MRLRRASRSVVVLAVLVLSSAGACSSDAPEESASPSTTGPTQTTEETSSSESPEDTPPPFSPQEELLVEALANVGVDAERAEIAFEGASLIGRLDGQEVQVIASGLDTVPTATTMSERAVDGVTVSEVTYGSGAVVDQFECQGLVIRVGGAARDAAQYDDFLADFITELDCV